jgi:hypothetical protein
VLHHQLLGHLFTMQVVVVEVDGLVKAQGAPVEAAPVAHIMLFR